MAERLPKQGPLDHLDLARRGSAGAEAEGVLLRAPPPAFMARLLGHSGKRFRERVGAALDLMPPEHPGRVERSEDVRVYTLAKGDWLIAGRDSDLAMRLARATADMRGVAQAVTDGWFGIEVAGPRARATLAKSANVDVDPAVLTPARCQRARIAGMPVILARRDHPTTYELFVARSLVESLWRWLEDAALEYGFAVRTGEDDLTGYGDT